MPARDDKQALGEFDDTENVSDSDSNLLSGVPLKATGGEDTLTLADIAVETPDSFNEDEITTGMPNHDFEFDVVQPEPSPPQDQTENEPRDDSDKDESESLLSGLSELDTDDDPIEEATADLNQLLGADDGSQGMLGEKGTFGISCPTCDSRLLVGLPQVGEQVKCGDCYSMVKVRSPTSAEIRQIEKQIALRQQDQAEDDDLQLAPLEELSEEEVVDDDALLIAELLSEADGSQELSDEGDDEEFGELKLEDLPEGFSDQEKEPLLDADQVMKESRLAKADAENADNTNSANSAEDDEPADVVFEDEDEDFSVPESVLSAGVVEKTPDDATVKKPVQKLNPYRSKSAQLAQKKAQHRVYKPNQTASDKRKSKLPKFTFDSLFRSAVQMVMEQSVVTRAMIAASLIALGNIVSHFALSNYRLIEEPTMADKAVMGAWRLGLGWALFGLGTMLLWYFAGVIFREAASGKKVIKSWNPGPSTEWTSTLLLTSFSFIVAGSPLLMLLSIYLTAPARFLIAVPFLTAVWLAQSPLMILSTDVLGDMRNRGKHWRIVYSVVLAQASIAFLAGILMHVSVPWLNIVTSILGAIFLSFVTLCYAAVVGWHSGNVVEELS